MEENRDINKIICKFIYANWIVTSQSQRFFASEHDIEESTVRKIKNHALGTSKSNYNMTINTLHKICKAKNITLEKFFSLINK